MAGDPVRVQRHRHEQQSGQRRGGAPPTTSANPCQSAGVVTRALVRWGGPVGGASPGRACCWAGPGGRAAVEGAKEEVHVTLDERFQGGQVAVRQRRQGIAGGAGEVEGGREVPGGFPSPRREVRDRGAEAPLEELQLRGVVKDVGGDQAAAAVGRDDQAGDAEAQSDRPGDAADSVTPPSGAVMYSPGVPGGGTGGGTWSKKPPFSS